MSPKASHKYMVVYCVRRSLVYLVLDQNREGFRTLWHIGRRIEVGLMVLRVYLVMLPWE